MVDPLGRSPQIVISSAPNRALTHLHSSGDAAEAPGASAPV